MAKLKKVKCIRIDSLNKRILFEDVAVPALRKPSDNPPGFEKGMIVGPFDLKAKFDHLCYYRQTVDHAKDIPTHGLLFRSTHEGFEELSRPFDRVRDSFRPIAGDALIVTYKVSERRPDRLAIPVDVQISLEQAQLLVGEWTNGVYFRLPDFTCILQESFSERGYEILLRVDNEAELYAQHAEELTTPIRHLNQQIINFTYKWEHEITIVTGKILDPDDNVHVSIFESGRQDLRSLAACTIRASKIPNWIQDRLQAYFFEHLIAKYFVSRKAREDYRVTSSAQEQNSVNI